MRGRKPRPLLIAPHDTATLQDIVRSRSLPWFQVQRARIVLGVARGQPIQQLADQTQHDPSTIWRVCRRYEDEGLPGRLAPPRRPGRPARISPLQRAQVVELACLEPVAKGLHITHWSSEALARQAVADGIVESISPRTVRQVLDDVDLQPHRTRYWRTTRLDAEFKARAEEVLWCYGNAERLAREGYWVVCADEQNDAANYIPALEAFRRRHRLLRGVYLIHDGGPSHVAAATAEYFAGCHGWWRPRFTPARASWLDQAELLIHAFSDRYLKRRSWSDREEFIRHVGDSWPEYNDLYAHPFEWTWTSQKMRRWFARHQS